MFVNKYTSKDRSSLFELLRSPEKKKQFLAILQHADFNITGVQVVERQSVEFIKGILGELRPNPERNNALIFLKETNDIDLIIIDLDSKKIDAKNYLKKIHTIQKIYMMRLRKRISTKK